MLYSDVVTSASAGATAGTFDNIGTITLRSDAKFIYGMWVEAALATSTAAEAFSGVLQVTSSDLGIGSQLFAVPPFNGGAPATNIGYSANRTRFVPLFKQCHGKEQIKIDYSSNLPDPTGAASVVVGVVYEAGAGNQPTIPKDVMATFPEMSMVSCGGDVKSVAAVTLVGGTAVGDLKAPAWSTEIVGLECYIVPNLMTAGEERVGYVEFTSTIGDFSPQKWPFAYGINAPLGTPVGQGLTAFDPVRYAFYFQKAKQNETITAKVYLNVAITTGDSVVAGIYFR
jgi:hypothetical protein